METATMGRVVVTAKIENLHDLYEANVGRIAADQVRKAEVADALVDCGATFLSLPKTLIAQLGLKKFATRRMRTTSGMRSVDMYDVVRLTVQNRFCHAEVAEVDDVCPVLIGQLPLEALDFVIDTKAQRLIGNPEHGGEQMADLF
jgi:predicted aspartyl protease